MLKSISAGSFSIYDMPKNQGVIMRIAYIFLAIFLTGVLPALAVNESETNIATTMAQTCNGTWHLLHTDLWSLQQAENGTTIPIPPDATIVNCDGRSTYLTDAFQGAEVRVLCSEPQNSEEVWHVQTVQILCK